MKFSVASWHFVHAQRASGPALICGGLQQLVPSLWVTLGCFKQHCWTFGNRICAHQTPLTVLLSAEPGILHTLKYVVRQQELHTDTQSLSGLCKCFQTGHPMVTLDILQHVEDILLCRTTPEGIGALCGAMLLANIFLGTSNSSTVQPVVGQQRSIMYRCCCMISCAFSAIVPYFFNPSVASSHVLSTLYSN